jgi:hypothetical protein
MKQAYHHRPHHFMRRIVGWSNDRQELLEMEHAWLRLIPDDQLSRRFYNLHNGKPGHWSVHDGKRMTVGQKISISNSKPFSAKRRETHLRGKPLSAAHRTAIGNANRDKPFSAKRRENIGNALRGRKHSVESRANMSDGQRRKPRIECPHCHRHFNQSNFTHWHGSRCKLSRAHPVID